MLVHVVEKPLKYDGTQLSSLFGFRNFGVQGDSVICFRGPCEVSLSELVDLADVRNNAPIYSEDMLHFIIEHFEHDLEKMVIRQRLFIAIIKEVLEQQIGIELMRSGDDLYFGQRKLSVSIATASPVSTMIHTGLNISSQNTPVPTISLLDLGFLESDLLSLGQIIAKAYTNEMSSIHMARCKVRGVN